MARVLAHPFRLQGQHVAVVEEGSDDGLAQMVAVIATTRRGEREMVPGFGVSDPTFDALSAAELNAALAMFGPPVQIDDIAAGAVDDVTEEAVITFAPVEEES